MQIKADLGPITIPDKGRFRPQGPLHVHGDKKILVVSARVRRTGVRLLTARFLVGFNVHGSPRWTEDDLIRMFVEIRASQGRSAGASFLTQRGVWQPIGGRREPDEQGAQIIVLNEDSISKATFIDEMASLGEELVRRMDQDAIYLDIQKAGLVIESLTLTAD